MLKPEVFGLAAGVANNAAAESGANRGSPQSVPAWRRDINWNPYFQAFTGTIALAVLTAIAFPLHAGITIALCLYLGIVVVWAFRSNPIVSVFLSVLAVGLIDFYFSPPLFSLSVNDPLNWIALGLFAGISLAVSLMVAKVKRRGRELEAANLQLRDQQAKELEHANRLMLMGEMTASIVHEINQPLTGIISNAGTSLRYLGAPNVDAAREYMQLVVRDGRRASDVVTRVRSMARRSPPKRSLLDVNEAIREVVGLLQAELRRQRAQLTLALADNLTSLSADRVQLQQVIMNLVMNAVEAMADVTDGDRIVTIESGSLEAGGIFFEVRDLGPGFKDDPERLFDPFYTTKTNGMGMGLSICRSIVQAHGGELLAVPNTPNGATFRVVLPGG